MIKTITQYVMVCDNPFCDSTVRFGVDHHSYDRKEQFIKKAKNRGWAPAQAENDTSSYICPSCRDFSVEIPGTLVMGAPAGS